MAMHPLRQHLARVGAALASGPMAARINRDSLCRLGAVATPQELAALEGELGFPLPRTLREVLGQVSADIEISWSLRSRETVDAAGFPRNEYLVQPPDEFLEWSQAPDAQGNYPPSARRVPRIPSGMIRFSLAGMRRAVGSLPGWLDLYRDDPDHDDETRAHFALIREFMSAGLPVWTAPNGDWLAIDLRDEDERLLHVSHEGEEAGIELGLTLPQFLAHLSWLGPVWPDYPMIFMFSDETDDVVPDDPRLQRADFDARSEAGGKWRQWFWDMTGLADPPPELLG